MIKKYFTPAQVDKMLPLLRHIGDSIVLSWGRIIELRTELDVLKGTIASGIPIGDYDPEEKVATIKAELNEEIENINSFIKEVESLGGYVQNFRPLHFDFPSVMYKRHVMLCLRPITDDVVTRYHEIDETCADATNIPH